MLRWGSWGRDDNYTLRFRDVAVGNLGLTKESRQQTPTIWASSGTVAQVSAGLGDSAGGSWRVRDSGVQRQTALGALGAISWQTRRHWR